MSNSTVICTKCGAMYISHCHCIKYDKELSESTAIPINDHPLKEEIIKLLKENKLKIS